ncbi:MAG: hypothetical protein LRZ85_06890 [Alphaproteobacteria bacterium]|nr:hypothetical protein [Alphaproteobacteria bacterium]
MGINKASEGEAEERFKEAALADDFVTMAVNGFFQQFGFGFLNRKR